MKVRELLESLDKSSPEDPGESIFLEVGFDCCFQQQDPVNLKYYWLNAHYCMGTWVGTRVYFLEDELVAVSYQRGRKYDEEFSWVSKEAYLKVKSYLKSLLIEEKGSPDIGDLDAEVQSGYALEYRGDLMPNSMHKVALLDGSKVVSILPFTEYPLSDRNEIAKTVLIESEGERSEVEIERLSFPWNCLPQIKTSWSETNQSFKAVYPPFPQLEAFGKTEEEARNNMRWFLNLPPRSEGVRGKCQHCVIFDDKGYFDV
jgi:hypothetical protein